MKRRMAHPPTDGTPRQAGEIWSTGRTTLRMIGALDRGADSATAGAGWAVTAALAARGAGHGPGLRPLA